MNWFDKLVLVVFVPLFLLFSVLLLLGASEVFTGRHPPRERSEMKGLEIGIKCYRTEYLRLPAVALDDKTPVETRGQILSILLAEDEKLNPRKVVFWEPMPNPWRNRSGANKTPSGGWELRDTWGNFYRILLDMDYDGVIPNPAKGTKSDEPDALSTDVILYSAGPDGDFTTWHDNFRSWQ